MHHAVSEFCLLMIKSTFYERCFWVIYKFSPTERGKLLNMKCFVVDEIGRQAQKFTAKC